MNLDDESDLTPSLHWPEPHLILEPKPEHGPVLITMEYLIDPPQSGQFAKAMRALSVVRRRDGAIRWGLFQDTANPGRFLETFIVETWMEHLRQHERMTVADRSIEEKAFSFHTGSERPQVQHLIYAYGAGPGPEKVYPELHLTGPGGKQKPMLVSRTPVALSGRPPSDWHKSLPLWHLRTSPQPLLPPLSTRRIEGDWQTIKGMEFLANSIFCLRRRAQIR